MTEKEKQYRRTNVCFVCRLCKTHWGSVSAYETDFAQRYSYKDLYMILDNGTLTFAGNPHEVGGVYLTNNIYPSSIHNCLDS